DGDDSGGLPGEVPGRGTGRGGRALLPGRAHARAAAGAGPAPLRQLPQPRAARRPAPARRALRPADRALVRRPRRLPPLPRERAELHDGALGAARRLRQRHLPPARRRHHRRGAGVEPGGDGITAEGRRALAPASPRPGPGEAPMDEPILRYETKFDGRVVVITLNRPERRNALNPELSAALVGAWERFAADDAAWVAILTGAGDQAFCAGQDLKARADRDRTGAPPPPPRRQIYPLSETLGLWKPTIAAINGYCIAGGWMLAQQCDI